jgi:LmbE family N-acetylglucosaminyl deacetylase
MYHEAGADAVGSRLEEERRATMPRAPILAASGLLMLALGLGCGAGPLEAADPPLRLLVIGAHPDDPEKVAGTMALYRERGDVVQLVSVTNGDAGHFEMGLGPLAVRRAAEARCSGDVIGAKYLVLDNHDGELMPTLAVRRQIIKVIREFRPDIVFSPRTDDYHPDHRATAELVRDAAYMVTVPNVVPLTPHLDRNPVFVFVEDRFTRPTPFQPDVVVDIDSVIDKKVDMYHCHTSQMYEWLPYNEGILDQVPDGEAARRAWLISWRSPGWRRTADRFRDQLIERYGPERGRAAEYAEAFEVSEYGSIPSPEELAKLFPF